MFKSRYLEIYDITVLLQLHILFATHNEFAQWLWIELVYYNLVSLVWLVAVHAHMYSTEG